jgi:acylphosphatase
MELIRAHVFISGRVQGVGYRYSTQDMAILNKLHGWVQNLVDGRVEAVFEGDRAAVEAMVAWCHQGPPHANVEQVIVQYETPEGLSGFEIQAKNQKRP